MKSIFIAMYICIPVFSLAQYPHKEINITKQKNIFFATSSVGYEWQITEKSAREIRKAGIKVIHDSSSGVREEYNKKGRIISRRQSSQYLLRHQEFTYNKRGKLLRVEDFSSHPFCRIYIQDERKDSFTYNIWGKTKTITTQMEKNRKNVTYIQYNLLQKPTVYTDSIFNEYGKYITKTVYQYKWNGKFKPSFFINGVSGKMPSRIIRHANFYKVLIDDSFYSRKACSDKQWEETNSLCTIIDELLFSYQDFQEEIYNESWFIYGVDYKYNKAEKVNQFNHGLSATDSFVYEKRKLKKWIFRCERCHEGPEVIYDFEYYKNGKIWKIAKKDAIIEYDKKGFPVKQYLMYEGKIDKIEMYNYEYYKK